MFIMLQNGKTQVVTLGYYPIYFPFFAKKISMQGQSCRDYYGSCFQLQTASSGFIENM